MVNQYKARDSEIKNLNDNQIQKLKESWKLLLNARNRDNVQVDLDKSEPAKQSKWGWFGMSRAKVGDINVINKTNELSVDEIDQELFNIIQVDHPDNVMVKFLIARNWVPSDAVTMLLNTAKFHRDEQVTQIKAHGEHDMPPYALTSGVLYFYGNDLDGNVVSYFNAKVHDPSQSPPEKMKKFILYAISMGYLPQKNRRQTVIFDLKDFSLSNMDYPNIKFFISTVQNNFPECLKRLIILDAPWIFNGIWNILSKFIDQRVKEKIAFVQRDQLPNYIDIDQIPEDKGGRASFAYSYHPPSDSVARDPKETEIVDKLRHERGRLGHEFYQLTERWILGDDVTNERCFLANNIAQNYCDLSPYIWGNSIYHRLGIVTEFDEIDFNKWH